MALANRNIPGLLDEKKRLGDFLENHPDDEVAMTYFKLRGVEAQLAAAYEDEQQRGETKSAA